VLIIGHRGASAAFPENTLAAFAGAATQGADGVELDLRRTADGGVVVRHDPTLPDGRLVVDLRTDELPDWVPSLDDVLAACADFRLLNLEVKNGPDDPDFDPSEAIAEQVVAALARLPDLREGVLVSSFHLPTIDRVRELDPGLATGWLTLGMADAMAVLDRAAAGGHCAVHPHVAFVDAAMVERAHELGLQLNTWTVDDPARLRELAELGVDAAITNAPDVALAALGRGA
jgi:glycerophosphoryl diester phosphodiesterase